MTRKKLTHLQIVRKLRALVMKGVRKGVQLRPGGYGVENINENPNACAIGSIEHALANGSRTFGNHGSIARKLHVPVGALIGLDNGFEYRGKARKTDGPFFVLGHKLRRYAVSKMSKADRAYFRSL
jgi:hypothetical protein